MTLTTDTTDSPCGDSDILALPLSAGAHGSEFHGETCLVEKSNRIAFCIPAFREQFGAPDRFNDDHPSISRVVRGMAIGLNDIPDAAWGGAEGRTAALDRFSVAILGTKTTDADEETRAWLATDWLIRVQTPAWLRLAGLTADAQALEGLARVVDAATARAAQPLLATARRKSDAAWAAARDAARDAAWAAARDAAGDALAPTAATLRTTAIELLDAMVAVGRSDK
jgi:hypothetical protein